MKIKYFNIIYLVFLLCFSIYIALDTFLLKQVYTKIENTSSNENTSNTDTIEDQQINTEENNISNNITKSDTQYIDDNINISLKTYRENDTNIYVADIIISNSDYLKTAFANNTFGKNITDKTSSIAKNLNAILAINGDYYGVQEKGYVLKNGIIYRNTAVNNKKDLVIYKDGSFEIINESNISLEELLQKGAINVLSFGPDLINNYEVSVSENDEVAKSMSSNPRTAIGIIDENHYIFVVSDGRTNTSVGLSLYQLANFMKKFNCEIAYNLDGGGSSTMYFNGNIINTPTTTGKRSSERSVSDIVYIGY